MKTRSLWSIASVVCATASLTSCALEEATSEEVERSAEAYQTDASWVWSQGEPAVNLGEATSSYFCALRGIGGRFRGDGEEVRVTRVPMKDAPGRYRWSLHGQSQQIDVHAGASCVRNVIGYTDEVLWSQGEASKILGPVSDRVCFLTRVRGHFAGDGESVRIRKSWNNWVLDGTSQQAGVRAGARCVYVPSDQYSDPEFYVYNGGSGGDQLALSARGGSGWDKDYCAMTRIRGLLDDVYSVGTLIVSNGTYGMWIHDRAPGPLTMGARCMYDPIVIR